MKGPTVVTNETLKIKNFQFSDPYFCLTPTLAGGSCDDHLQMHLWLNRFCWKL